MFALAFSVLGYFMKKFQYPAPPLILGLILGSMAEQNLNRTLMIHQKLDRSVHQAHLGCPDDHFRVHLCYGA